MSPSLKNCSESQESSNKMINISGQGTTASKELQLTRQPRVDSQKSSHQHVTSSRLGEYRWSPENRESPQVLPGTGCTKRTRSTGSGLTPVLEDQGNRVSSISQEICVPRLVTETDASPQHRWGLAAMGSSHFSIKSSPFEDTIVQKVTTTTVTDTHAYMSQVPCT